MDQVRGSAAEAVADISSGSTLAVGGFGLCGIPAFFTATGVGTHVADGGLPWKFRADGTTEIASPAKQTQAFDKHIEKRTTR